MKMPPLVFDQFHAPHVPPAQMDDLWAQAWRHFGREFFRYSISADMTSLRHIQPLRIDVGKFSAGKSQRRVLRRNAGLRVEVRPARITPELEAMFHRHKQRFTSNVPESLADFIAPGPASSPCACWQFGVYDAERLLAASYLDTGLTSASSVYGMFEPECSGLSLGIFTMLVELEWAAHRGMRYYYPGYATVEPSHYDYKKSFAAMEVYDWAEKNWHPLKSASAILKNPAEED